MNVQAFIHSPLQPQHLAKYHCFSHKLFLLINSLNSGQTCPFAIVEAPEMGWAVINIR